MISLMDYRTCKYVSIDEKQITNVTDGYETIGSRTYPYSDVFLFNENTGREKVIRVVESPNKIGRLMANAIEEQTKNK